MISSCCALRQPPNLQHLIKVEETFSLVVLSYRKPFAPCQKAAWDTKENELLLAGLKSYSWSKVLNFLQMVYSLLHKHSQGALAYSQPVTSLLHLQ